MGFRYCRFFRILPGLRLPEGPYGEFTWYYGLERPSPVMEVTAITHRRDMAVRFW